MKLWHRKLLIDTAKAAIPFQSGLRRLTRRVKPYSTNPANTEHLIVDGLDQLDMLRDADVRVEGADILEFGSGWLPVIPLLFRLAGAKTVTLTDQERLMDGRLIEDAITIIRDHNGFIAQRLHKDIKAVNFGEPSTGAGLESKLLFYGLKYLVPFSPSVIPDSSMDIVTSRAVLEHVPERLLNDFMRQFRRMLKPEGAMCHTIDMSDHWEHLDKSIGRINFLRYSDWVWNMTCLNPQNFQNRLRRIDYVQMMEQNEFKIIKLIGEPDARALIDFDSMRVASKFNGLSREEAATLTCSVLSKPIKSGATPSVPTEIVARHEPHQRCRPSPA